MTITRTINGEQVSITLTNEELGQAYLEQEHLYDMEDVRQHIHTLFDDGDIDSYCKVMLLKNIDSIAYDKRKHEDSADDPTWWCACRVAVTDALGQV